MLGQWELGEPDPRKVVPQEKGGCWRGTDLLEGGLRMHVEGKAAGNELQEGKLIGEVVSQGKEEGREPALLRRLEASPCSLLKALEGVGYKRPSWCGYK